MGLRSFWVTKSDPVSKKQNKTAAAKPHTTRSALIRSSMDIYMHSKNL